MDTGWLVSCKCKIGSPNNVSDHLWMLQGKKRNDLLQLTAHDVNETQ